MSAVSAPPVHDTLVSQPQREVLYAASRRELRLVHTPTYPILGAGGRPVGVEHGITVAFRDGVLRLPLEGEVATESGRKFDAAELIEWLERHRLNGDMFEGFSRIQQVAPPMSEAEVERITEAATLHDVETLTAMLEAERAGWGRSDVVGVLERRLEQIARVTAHLREQVEAETRAEAAKAEPRAKAKS